MLSDEHLCLAVRELSRSGQRTPTLLILSQLGQPAKTRSIRSKGLEVGFRDIAQWNLSEVLRVAAREGQVAQLASGWKLLAPGLKAIEKFYTPEAPMVAETRHSLKSHLIKISDEQRKTFLEEAIRCFDVKSYRAAVVLSWVGAVHIIQEYVVAKHRSNFNSAGAARAAKTAANGRPFLFSPIKSIKDFGTLGEGDLLQVCQDSGIIHKAEKQVLEDRLNLRNQCGHPNPVVVAEHAVANHIEVLMLNVYAKY